LRLGGASNYFASNFLGAALDMEYPGKWVKKLEVESLWKQLKERAQII
jgi:hypothetical protein